MAGGLPAWHCRCSEARQRLPGDLHVIDRKRLLPAILLCGFALALWPSEAAAQHRGRPVRSGGSTVVVVRPSFHGGYYGYNAPLFWRYGGWYPYGLYAPYYPAEAYSHSLDAGVGYRAIGGADLLQGQLRGVSGSIALRFGGH